jgi:hypothetical protein
MAEYSDSNRFVVRVPIRYFRFIGAVERPVHSWEDAEHIIAAYMRKRGNNVIVNSEPHVFDFRINGYPVDCKLGNGKSTDIRWWIHTSHQQLTAMQPNGYFLYVTTSGLIYRVSARKILFILNN